MLSKTTASSRATAIMARFLPRLPPLAASPSPQRRSSESAPTRLKCTGPTALINCAGNVAGPGNAALRVGVARLLLRRSEAEKGASLAVRFHRLRIIQGHT